MGIPNLLLKNRILLSILLPVLAIGLLISGLSIVYLSPPLMTYLKDRIDSELKLASKLGLGVCEKNFNYLLDLRLEDDPEMNAALKKETIQEISALHARFHKIHLLVIENERLVIGSSTSLPMQDLNLPRLETGSLKISTVDLWGEPLRMHVQYFPFWHWHVLSFTTEYDYVAPIVMAKRIVYGGTFGVLFVVVMAAALIFHFLVNRPLKRIIRATEGVARGDLKQIDILRRDEIGKVAASFNSMVGSLEEDQRQINAILSELKESEEMYRLITEHSLAHITMVQDGRIIYGNPRAIQTSGYPPEEYIGIHVRQLIHPDDWDMVRSKALNRRKEGPGVQHYEFRYLTKGGKVRWLEILVVPILFKGRQVALGHAVDFTQRKEAEREQKRLERRLQQAQKMEAIGTLAAGVAHDLNNILSGLVSYPELLLMDMAKDSPLRKPILTIQESGQKAAAIVQDLLTLARRGVAVTEVVNLNDIVSQYLHSPEYEKMISFHTGLRVKVDLSPGLLNISGSPVHLSKTIMNLVSNAAEAMLDGGTVYISTKNVYVDRKLEGYDDVDEGDYAVLSVSDTGIGISQGDREKIFEPFYTKKVMGRSGTGLGMAVVWGTVKDHDGYIDLQSIEGEGSRFELYFPTTSEAVLRTGDQVPIEEYRGGGEFILIVDDVKEQRDIARRMLEKLGYQVSSVSSGEEALAYLRDHRPDLLVLDMIMDPGMDGLDTYKKVLEIRPGQKTIIASGFSETERVREAQRLGAGAYIKKPYLLEVLGTTIRKELEKDGHPGPGRVSNLKTN